MAPLQIGPKRRHLRKLAAGGKVDLTRPQLVQRLGITRQRVDQLLELEGVTPLRAKHGRPRKVVGQNAR